MFARLSASLSISTVLLVSGCVGSADAQHEAEETSGFEEAYQQVELGKQDVGGCSGVLLPDSSGFNRRVALTFDDGPNPATTPRVLDILKAHGIHATFFINGQRVNNAASRAVLRRILNEGHILANHSQQHLNLKTLSGAALRAQVDQTNQIIVTAGGTPEYFRFPFGSASCEGMSYVRDQGYRVTGWHIDSADWCYAASSDGSYCAPRTFQYVEDRYRRDMVAGTIAQIERKNGGVVLFHDIHRSTADKLDAIITELETKGFRFVGVDDEAAFPRLNGAQPARAPFIGDPCSSSVQCHFTYNGREGVCHLASSTGAPVTQGFCTLECEGTCPDLAGRAPTFCTSLDEGESGSCVAKAAPQFP
jgi:peptidoglycan/xylan/chitin deacetylase (PgdA/CDA1 family)